MSFMPAQVFISGAGLSYCSVYMMSGRHENFRSLYHAGMRSHVGGKETLAGMKIQIMKAKFPLFSA